MLRGLFAHGTAEEFGQCGIEAGAGLLPDLIAGLFYCGEMSVRVFRGKFVITHPLSAFAVAALSL